jgi:deoxyadenosine/deoxycytidine kinase
VRADQGKLIAVVGNSGVGKTTFANALCRAGGFTAGLEQHPERPFQQRFAQDLKRYALPNQVDYLLLRAEQEWSIRSYPGVGVVDGGLDQDFYIFTRLFFQRCYLDQPDFELCERQYRFYRQVLPVPDLTVWLQAPVQVIIERFNRRERPIQITQADDLQQIEGLLHDWMTYHPPMPCLVVDVSTADRTYPVLVDQVLQEIKRIS